ncbi:MAG: NfeD family protein [Beijerinckiaceae bacterium]|nr:NfeD family protein [Beijerinckiaceae bacterium]
METFWYWLIGGILLCAAEALAPGMFLLWLGVAAIATGLLMSAINLSFAWSMIWFGLLAIVAVVIGRKFYGASERESDQPFLNRRADAMVGRTYVLAHPIKAGEGRLIVNDTQWGLRGPDLPAGTKVLVTGVQDSTFLLVEQA